MTHQVHSHRRFTPRAIILALSIVIVGQISLKAQENAASSGAMPDRIFYPHIFRHVLHLQNMGVAPPAAALPSLSTLDYYERRAGMTPTEVQIIVQAALAWKSVVDPIDAKAQAIIDKVHAATPGGRLKPGESPPGLPKELVDLQTNKDAITANVIASLGNKFGAERFSQINSRLHSISRTSRGSSSQPVPSAPLSGGAQ